MTESAIASPPSLVSLAMLALLNGTPAHAAPTKVWVSNAGSDGNPCALAAPCKSFEHALGVVAGGGEISVLTPGDYGGTSSLPLTVTKSVTIINDGAGDVGIQGTDPTSAGVLIVAGLGDVVSLRGLIIDGVGSGQIGVLVDQASAVHIQNCVIRNFEGGSNPFGIAMIASNGTQSMFVSDSLIYNNGAGATSGGVLLQAQSSGSIKAVLNRLRLENNVLGLRVQSASAANSARVTLRDSTLVGNASDGVLVTVSGGGATAFVERTASVNNAGIGMHADGSHAVILLSDSSITKNGTGVSATSGGQVISYRNNRNINNIGAEGTATGTLSLF